MVQKRKREDDASARSQSGRDDHPLRQPTKRLRPLRSSPSSLKSPCEDTRNAASAAATSLTSPLLTRPPSSRQSHDEAAVSLSVQRQDFDICEPLLDGLVTRRTPPLPPEIVSHPSLQLDLAYVNERLKVHASTRELSHIWRVNDYGEDLANEYLQGYTPVYIREELLARRKREEEEFWETLSDSNYGEEELEERYKVRREERQRSAAEEAQTTGHDTPYPRPMWSSKHMINLDSSAGGVDSGYSQDGDGPAHVNACDGKVRHSAEATVHVDATKHAVLT
ncbi:Hypothetical predicted protein [Lecanosticta acicola]|uniref:Uncharacterized protein n=1 Tax=Lecanosticta acicola TaxID=111012 RepID=A0AAI9E733_9PEZI|nr:Hypothetical predicted protein [Lecanosticta acicola]